MSRLSSRLSRTREPGRIVGAGAAGSGGSAGAAAVAAVAAVVMIGGCGAAPQSVGSTGHRPSAASTRNGSGELSATRALMLASRDARRVSSMTMTATMTMRGLPAMAAGGGIISRAGQSGASGGLPPSGTVKLTMAGKMRLRPSLLFAMSIGMGGIGGRSVRLSEVLTPHGLYFKMPGILPTRPGKPWAKISLAALPNGMNLSKLLRQTQNGNPLTAMGSPAALAKLLAAAKHLRVVRGQIVDGVATTEYSGTLSPRSLMSVLPAAERKLLGSAPVVRVGIPFKVWIDGQHHTRKVVMRLSMGKASMAMKMNITSINKPVRIVPPPASEVSAMSIP